MSSSAEAIFDFIRDIVYDPENAKIDLDAISEDDLHDVAEGLCVLNQMISEMRSYATELSEGNIDVEAPGRENPLAAPIKNLHAALRHITWQTSRVAVGDYQHRIDFMGEFANSFNTMVRELAAHKKMLELEIEAREQRNKALENSVNLFKTLTENIPQSLVVISSENEETLFVNHTGEKTLKSDPALHTEFVNLMLNDLLSGEQNATDERVEVTAGTHDSPRYYMTNRYHIRWSGCDAIAFVAEDITKEKLNFIKLERLANIDELTKLYVRRFGMEIFEQWIAERKQFSLCFVDLDFLKYTNDTFGHEVGDFYITTAARLLREMHDGAVVARLGGDEFMMLIPGLDEEQILPYMDKLEQDLAEAPKNMDADELTKSMQKFHASFGIVTVPTDGSAVPSDILAAADKKMYDYKMAHKAARRA